MSEEINARLSVVEVELINLKDTLKEFKEDTKKVTEIVFEVKTHLDKQNGILPSIKQCIERVESRLDRVETIDEKVALVATKVKILWGVIAVIGAALVTSVVKILVF